MNITEKAMLVRLAISQWTARRFDFKATRQLIEDHGAKADSGRFNKLLVDNIEVKKYQHAASEARIFHYENTLPWGDDHERILPADNYLAYTQKMRELKSKFEKAANDFIEEYPLLIEKAEKDLSGLFSSKDYPTPHELRGKFAFDISVVPVPTANDFRVSLSDDDVNQIKIDIEAKVKDSITSAMGEAWKRLFTAVKHMAVKLSNDDAVFRNSLIGNIAELCDLLPRLNITNDPKLTEIIKDARKALVPLDPKDLRDKQIDRKKATVKAKAVLEKMTAYMGN